MNSEINYVSPFKRFCITIGNLPTAYIESMSYYEGLTFLVNYLSNNVIPALNNNGEVVEELQNQFVILKNYVDNYFENLDVQEEINNKLDEMAESGQLTDIIAQYLGLAGMITFNNISEMKAAENLVNGSKCCTLGYYDVNDGGKALYKIRTIINTDVIDEMTIIALNDINLIAELVEDDNIYPEQLGAKGDNTNDDTTILNTCFSKFKNINLMPNKTYKITNRIDIKSNTNLKGNNATIHRISSNGFNSILSIEDENNITIRDLNLISESDQVPVTISDFPNYPNSLTSNLTAFRIKGTNNLYIENINISDTTYALYITGTQDDLYTHNNNITAKNFKCNNIYCGILGAFCNNVICENFTINGSEYIPSGYHLGCYINQYVGKVNLDKFNIIQNGIYNRGPIFDLADYTSPSDPDSYANKNVTISNFNIKGCRFMNAYIGGKYKFINGVMEMIHRGVEANNVDFPSEDTGSYTQLYLDRFNGEIIVNNCKFYKTAADTTYRGSFIGTENSQTSKSDGVIINNCILNGFRQINLDQPVSYKILNSLIDGDQATIAIGSSSVAATEKEFINCRINWYNRNTISLVHTLSTDRILFSNVEYNSTHSNNNPMIYSTDLIAGSTVILDKVNVIGTDKLIDTTASTIITNYCSIEYVPYV